MEVPVEVRRSARRKRTLTAYREGDRIVVLVPDRFVGPDADAQVDSLVRRLIDRENRAKAPSGDAALTARAARLYDEHLREIAGEPPPFGVCWVSNQNRRWGSATPETGQIRISDRLRAAPDWVVDYVLMHELTHLLERGHTPRFHDLVGRFSLAERARGYLEGYLAGRAD